MKDRILNVLMLAAVAAALTGTITDPRTLGIPAPEVEMPERFKIDDSGVLAPAAPEDAAAVEVLRGPNIKAVPAGKPVPDSAKLTVSLKGAHEMILRRGLHAADTGAGQHLAAALPEVVPRAEPLHEVPDLRLEDDDQRQHADVEEGSQEGGHQLHVERHQDDLQHEEQDDGDEDVHGRGPADPAEHEEDDRGDHQDVHHVGKGKLQEAE